MKNLKNKKERKTVKGTVLTKGIKKGGGEKKTLKIICMIKWIKKICIDGKKKQK